jgi:hypothetical protein
MKRLATILAALVPFGASAIGPYACHPEQSMYGTGSAAVWQLTPTSSCAVWTCNGVAQLAVSSKGAPTAAMAADWAAVASGPSPLNSMRLKYAKDDACSPAMLPAWAKCRASLTAEQVRPLCPDLK